MGSRSMKDVGGAVLAGSTPPFLGRKRAAIDIAGHESLEFVECITKRKNELMMFFCRVSILTTFCMTNGLFFCGWVPRTRRRHVADKTPCCAGCHAQGDAMLRLGATHKEISCSAARGPPPDDSADNTLLRSIGPNVVPVTASFVRSRMQAARARMHMARQDKRTHSVHGYRV